MTDDFIDLGEPTRLGDWFVEIDSSHDPAFPFLATARCAGKVSRHAVGGTEEEAIRNVAKKVKAYEEMGS